MMSERTEISFNNGLHDTQRTKMLLRSSRPDGAQYQGILWRVSSPLFTTFPPLVALQETE
jgi:hypothetical protein